MWWDKGATSRINLEAYLFESISRADESEGGPDDDGDWVEWHDNAMRLDVWSKVRSKSSMTRYFVDMMDALCCGVKGSKSMLMVIKRVAKAFGKDWTRSCARYSITQN